VLVGRDELEEAMRLLVMAIDADDELAPAPTTGLRGVSVVGDAETGGAREFMTISCPNLKS
jgi:hypothetical protein